MRKLVMLCCLLALAGTAYADTDGPFLQVGTRVSPEYPPAALAARFDGSVLLAVVIKADGSVGEVEVMESTRPNLGFEDAAITALKQWRFDPAIHDGDAVDSVAAYQLDFNVPQRGLRNSPYVSGYYLTSTISGAVKAGTPVSQLVQSGFDPASHQGHRRSFDTPKKPRVGEGQMYDRRLVLPPSNRTGAHSTSSYD